MPSAAPLANRSTVRIGGADCRDFLQNLVSNDVAKATMGHAVYAALLTPQGKFLHDLYIGEHEGGFLVDCEAARADDLLARLAAYKLRSKVTFENLADRFDVWAIWGGDTHAPLTFPDPRLPQLGYRAFVDKNTAPAQSGLVSFADYDRHRLTLGVADGSRDMEIEKSTLIESNFDYLHGIDWKKGCYMGQELTARMHYRGLAKKRLFPVRIEGEIGSEKLLSFNGTEAGQIRSHSDELALALLNMDAVKQSIAENAPFICNGARVFASKPAWMPQKG